MQGINLHLPNSIWQLSTPPSINTPAGEHTHIHSHAAHFCCLLIDAQLRTARTDLNPEGPELLKSILGYLGCKNLKSSMKRTLKLKVKERCCECAVQRIKRRCQYTSSSKNTRSVSEIRIQTNRRHGVCKSLRQ